MADIARIARLCHEANCAIQRAAGEEVAPSWDEASADMRESTMAGVRAVIHDGVASAEAQHEAWMAERIAAGWKHGKHKDVAKKTHPCLVPYAELAPMQRAKDEVFQAIVRAAVLG